MEDFFFIDKELCGYSESNDSTDGSLDGSEADLDMFGAMKESEIETLFNACKGLDICPETLDNLNKKCTYNNQQGTCDLYKPKTRGGNNKTTAKNETLYINEHLSWNYKQKRINYDPRPISKRSRKRSIPEEMKDDAYWKKRCQNTERARKSREARRLKEIEVLQKVKTLEQEKSDLQAEVNQLKNQVELLNERLMIHKHLDFI